MVIILEGPNRCGKTTYAEMLQRAGFKYFKSNEIVPNEHSLYRMKGMVDVLKAMDEQGVNCVVDRFHITDRVYGRIVRGENVDITSIDKLCHEAGFVLIFMTDIVEKIIARGAKNKTPADLDQLIKAYEEEFSASTMMKYRMRIGELV